jgi:hypothetical protein
VLLRQDPLITAGDGLHPYWILALVDKETKSGAKSERERDPLIEARLFILSGWIRY